MELKAVKLVLLNFNKQKPLKAIHFQIESTTPLLYLVKMGWGGGGGGGGGDREPNVTEASPETQDYNYYRIPSKYFECGGKLSVWKQQRPITIEILPKSISASLPQEGNHQSKFACLKYLAWKSDAFTQGTEAQQQIWCNQFPNSANQTRKMIFVTPTWHSQNLYHFLLKISIFSSPAA